MRILMLAQHFAPEEVSGAVLATELAEDLVQRGHEVTFVTATPSYPKGEIFAGYRNRLKTVEFYKGVRVVRVWSYISPKKSFWPRILNFGTFSLMAILGGLGRWRPDIIFSYSPPLPLGISAWLLSRWWHVPWVLRIEDLYPDAAIATGVLKNRQAIQLLTQMESFLYRRAHHISLISEGFRNNLLGKGQPADKLSVLPVWADPEEIRPLPKENGFRQRYGLSGKFVVLYAGNIGVTSALENVIDAAQLLRNKKGIVFLIVGDGVKKPLLMQEAKHHGLDNIRFLDYQPRPHLPEMLAAADVSLVTLNPESSPYSLPGKTFTIMASGRPILAITPLESEIAHLIQEARCGINVPPNHPEQLAAALLTVSADPEASINMGLRGRKYLEIRFSRSVCIDQFEVQLRGTACC